MAVKAGRNQLSMVLRQALRDRVNYYETSGSVVHCQMKTEIKTGGTTAHHILELAGRYSDGAAGADFEGLVIEMDLRGTTGDISSVYAGIEVAMCSNTGSTRTVTGPVSCLRAFNRMHGTVTTGPYVIYVETAEGNKAWAGFARFCDDGGNMADLASATATVNSVVKCTVGSTTTYLVGYATYTPT